MKDEARTGYFKGRPGYFFSARREGGSIPARQDAGQGKRLEPARRWRPCDRSGHRGGRVETLGIAEGAVLAAIDCGDAGTGQPQPEAS